MSKSLSLFFVLAAALLFFGFAMLTQANARTNYALITGVTKYPNLEEKYWLVGPDNDARLVRDYLVGQAGFDSSNVMVLADGVEGAITPTLQNIRGAIAELVKKIEADSDPEKFVYLHFSGHGSQMPAREETGENDGKDEVFLPADAKKWDRAANGFPNAYVDDDIGADIAALRKAGAFVWAVFDACHSSSATRAAPGESMEVSRRLDPRELGAPDDAVMTATRSTGGLPERENPVESTDKNMGGLVAFFAAQTVETTPEMPLPRDSNEQERYGLFTYTLFESIAKNPGISYRQLGQSILQAYAAMNRRAPTPLFEGELDSKVFGIAGEPAITQWPVKVNGARVTIPAGKLHRLNAGTRLALLRNPADETEKALGYLEVASVKNLESTLKPVAFENLPAPAVEAANNAWARPVELTVGFELVVSRTAPSDLSEPLNQSLERLANDKSRLFRIRLVEPGEPADIALALLSEAEILATMEKNDALSGTVRSEKEAIRASASTEQRLWFLPASGDASLLKGMRSPSVPGQLLKGDPEKIDHDLAERLTTIYRAVNLARITEASDFPRERLELTFLIKRQDSDGFEEIEPGKVPFVSDFDQIHVRIVNKSSSAVDLNVVHIATDYAITVVPPARIERNGDDQFGLFQVDSATTGIERLVAVITEALPGSDTEDLRFLTQSGLRSGETEKGVGEGGGVVGLLHGMGKFATTRGTTLLSDAKGAKGAVMIFPIEIVKAD